MAQYIQILIRYCRVGVLPLLLLLAAGSSLAATSATKSYTSSSACFPYSGTAVRTCSISSNVVSCTETVTCNVGSPKIKSSSSTGPETLVNVWFPSTSFSWSADDVCASSATARQYCWKIQFLTSSRDMVMNQNRDSDNDFDGLDNTTDTDDDNDGVVDASDAFPLNAAEFLDTDSDGIGNNADLDDDGDSVPDYIDADPLNAANSNEITLPLNNGYKGSQLRDSSGVQ